MTTEPPPDNATVALHDLAAAIRQGKDTRDIARRLAHHWPNTPHRSYGLLLQRLNRAKQANQTNSNSRHFLEPVPAMQKGGAYLLAVEGKTATVYILVQNDDAIARNNTVAATAIYRITKR